MNNKVLSASISSRLVLNMVPPPQASFLLAWWCFQVDSKTLVKREHTVSSGEERKIIGQVCCKTAW